MILSLENEYISILTNSKGAELKAVIGKKNGTRFLYSGEGKYWDYSSPVLFPYVGRLKGGSFLHNGKSYDMPIHGFARFKEFKASQLNNCEISFILKSDNETLKIYPFEFTLEITYKIVVNRIKITYRVENNGENDMYFGLGAHPGFLCPVEENELFSDYYLEFDEKENISLMEVTEEGLFSGKTIDFLKHENRINLNFNLFENDACVFSQLKSKGVSLRSINHSKGIRVDFDGFNLLGVWTIPGAPFLCIEPWISHGDFMDFKGELRQKEGIITLKPREDFTRSLLITFFE